MAINIWPLSSGTTDSGTFEIGRGPDLAKNNVLASRPLWRMTDSAMMLTAYQINDLHRL